MENNNKSDQRISYLRRFLSPSQGYDKLSSIFRNRVQSDDLNKDTTMPAKTTDNDYSANTQSNFYKSTSLTPDYGYYTKGDLNDKWQTQETQDNVSEPTPTSAPKPVIEYYPEFKSTPTLKNGSKSSNVKDLQNYLKTMGYNPGPIDGIFGAKTKAAVKRLQSAMSLSSDGIVGKNTWSAINSHLEKPKSQNPASKTPTEATKSQYEILLDGPLPYSPKSDDELKDIAINEMLSDFNDKWKAYQDQYQRDKSKLGKSEKDLSSVYRASMGELDGLYNARKAEAEAQALKRGIGRSTMAVNLVDAVKEEKTAKGMNLLQDYNTEMIDINDRFYDLEIQLSSERASMDANLNSELTDRYNQLLTEQDDKIMDILKYNTNLLNEQKEFEEKMKLEWKKYYKK